MRKDKAAFFRAGRVSHFTGRSEEHTSELQSQSNLVCRLLLEKNKRPQRRFLPASPGGPRLAQRVSRAAPTQYATPHCPRGRPDGRLRPSQRVGLALSIARLTL